MSSKTIFNSLTFCISGTLSKGRKEVENDIKKYGGKTASSITKSVTHLITTEKEIESETTKVKAAQDSNGRVKLVKEDFIWDSINSGKLLQENKYYFGNDDDNDEEDDDDGDDDGQDDTEFQPQLKKRKMSNYDDDHSIIVKFTNFSLINDDLIFSIFKFITIDELMCLCRVSKHFNSLITNENNEATITFLIETMNNYMKSTRKVSEPYKFFSLLHDEEYSDSRHSKLLSVSLDGEETTESIEVDDEKRQFPINITQERINNRLLISLDKFKEMLNRRRQSVEKSLKINPNAKRELITGLSLLENIKFRFAYDQKLISPLRRVRVVVDEYGGEDGACNADQDDGLVDNNNSSSTGPTFKGASSSIKKQLRLLEKHIENFEEINFGKHAEDVMDTSPKVYIDWIEKNCEILKNIKSLYYLDLEQTDAEVSWISIGNISPIWNAIPSLNFWKSKGSNDLTLSKQISHHNLRSITLISTGLSESFLRNLFSAFLPKLAHLELFLGTSDHGIDFEPSFLKDTLLSEEENGLFPSLEYLGLRNYEKIDDIAGNLFDSSIAKRVKIIDVSLGTLSDKGVLKFIGKLEKNLTTDYMILEVLDMNRCYLTRQMRERLLELPIIVDAEPSEEDDYVVDVNEEDEDDMGDRYIALSE